MSFLLSVSQGFHKIWPNLSPFTEYWPFQIHMYEKRKSSNLERTEKRNRVYMFFPKNKIGKTISSYPFFIFCYETFYIILQWHWLVFSSLWPRKHDWNTRKTVLYKRCSDLNKASFTNKFLSLEITWNITLTILLNFSYESCIGHKSLQESLGSP